MSITGKAIREQREKRRWTQTELAEMIGVTAQAISSWEKGRTIPDIENVTAIARAMNCSINELLNPEATFKLTTNLISKDEEEILALWRKAPFKTKVEIYQKLSEVNTSQVEEL